METRFTVLLIEVGVAVAVQIGLLAAILMVVRRSGRRMESLVNEVEHRILPTLDSAKAIMESSRPLLDEILKNASASSLTVRQQLERTESTLNDILDRTRLQVIRADDMATRALDKVEQTTEVVANSVVSPVRQVAGVVQGVAAGVESFFNNRRSRNRGTQRDEMFI
ncbi:MAG TPA: hypothetical protein VG892_10495 [Terriglobales bacterium]|jgi:hypothetical protein|nr:hypothetical protein [Terriglobales bacterium]